MVNLHQLFAIILACGLLLPGCSSKEKEGDRGTDGASNQGNSSTEVFTDEPMVKGGKMTPLPNEDLSSLPLPEEEPSSLSLPKEDPLAKPAIKNHNSGELLDSIYTQGSKLNLCDGNLDQSLSQDLSQIYDVGNNTYVAEVLCFMAAYQGNYEYVLYKDNQFKRLPLKMFDEKGQELNVKNVAGLPTYDPGSKTLEVVTKGRGLGDCGSLAQYKFDGNEFKLMEYRAKNECDGQYLEPDQYPILFPGGAKTKSNSPTIPSPKENQPSPPSIE